jgi:hypothetical protein
MPDKDDAELLAQLTAILRGAPASPACANPKSAKIGIAKSIGTTIGASRGQERLNTSAE